MPDIRQTFSQCRAIVMPMNFGQRVWVQLLPEVFSRKVDESPHGRQIRKANDRATKQRVIEFIDIEVGKIVAIRGLDIGQRRTESKSP